MASIGKLVTHLMVDSSNFDRKMGASKKIVGGFTSFVKRSMQVGVVAGMAAAGAAVVTLKSQLESLDKVAKLSTRTGFDPATIAAFGFAAEQSGSSVEAANKSLDQFTRRLGDAADGTGEAATALKMMNIPLDEILNARPEDQLLRVANAISQLPNEAERANAAYQLFGRSGQELVNVLALGENGIKSFIGEAKDLGLGFSAAELQKVEDANDAINRLKRAVGAVGAEFAVKVSPAVEAGVTAMREKFATFRDWMKPQWANIEAIAVGTWKAIEAAVNASWEGITAVSQAAMDILGKNLAGGFDDITRDIVTSLATIEYAFEQAMKTASGFVGGFTGPLAGLAGQIGGVKEAVIGLAGLQGVVAVGGDGLQAKIDERLSALDKLGPPKAAATTAAAGGNRTDGVDALSKLFGKAFDVIGKAIPDLSAVSPQQKMLNEHAARMFAQQSAVTEFAADKTEPVKAQETRFAGAMERGSAEAMKLLAMQIGGGKVPEKQLTEQKTSNKLLKGIWDAQNRRDEPVIFQAEGPI